MMARIRQFLTGVLAAAALAAGPGGASAVQPAEGQGWYQERERGWFWYEVDPELEPDEQFPDPALAPAPAAGPPPLSAEWYRERLDAYRDRAIDEPTPENVELYLYLQKAMVDKADRFAQAVQLATYRNPALDQQTNAPTSAVAKAAAATTQDTLSASLLGQIAGAAGLWYFYRSDCPYCAAQTPALDALRRQYGFSILPISLDGMPMPDGLFPEYVIDEGQAARLRVVATPTLFLVAPPNRMVRIAQGVLPGDQLEERILRLASEEGLITREAYEATRVEARRYLVDALPQQLEDAADDPARLLSLLRAASVNGGYSPYGNASPGVTVPAFDIATGRAAPAEELP